MRVGGGNRQPTLPAAGYDKQAGVPLLGRRRTVTRHVALADIGADLFDPQATWWAARTNYDIRDMDRNGGVSTDELYYYDFTAASATGCSTTPSATRTPTDCRTAARPAAA